MKFQEKLINNDWMPISGVSFFTFIISKVQIKSPLRF